jgi:hypothetical protein
LKNKNKQDTRLRDNIRRAKNVDAKDLSIKNGSQRHRQRVQVKDDLSARIHENNETAGEKYIKNINTRTPKAAQILNASRTWLTKKENPTQARASNQNRWQTIRTRQIESSKLSKG